MQRTGRLSERVTHALQGDSEEDEHRDMEAKKSDSMQETSVRIARLAVMSSRGRGEKWTADKSQHVTAWKDNESNMAGMRAKEWIHWF